MMIDNCCTYVEEDATGNAWRSTSSETYLFHAVQRISKSLSKKHPYFYNFLRDLRLVFRNKGNNGPKRTIQSLMYW